MSRVEAGRSLLSKQKPEIHRNTRTDLSIMSSLHAVLEGKHEKVTLISLAQSEEPDEGRFHVLQPPPLYLPSNQSVEM
jgi:hypothetical protein